MKISVNMFTLMLLVGAAAAGFLLSAWIFEAFLSALETSLENRYKGMTAVCLEPCHKFSHPLMVEL